MWKDKCHKCGRNIWNDVPEEHRNHIDEYVKDMEKQGWYLGHNTKTVGMMGNIHTVPIEPICGECSAKEYNDKYEKEKKEVLRKVIPTIKKFYICPVCEYSQKLGYNTEVFKTTSKTEMIEHIKTHDLKELKDVVPKEFDF